MVIERRKKPQIKNKKNGKRKLDKLSSQVVCAICLEPILVPKNALIHKLSGIQIDLDDLKKLLTSIHLRVNNSVEIDYSELTPDQEEDFDSFEGDVGEGDSIYKLK